MSQSTAIGSVSALLKDLIIDKKDQNINFNVTILAPDQGETPPRVNLFLYKIQESPTLKNMDWQVKTDDATKTAAPPLSLNLFYLMTPYAADDPTAHAILGEAMRVFYEYATVPQDILDNNDLQDAREQISIIQHNVDMNELSQIWGTFNNKPFRLSVMYEVSVIQLDQSAEAEKPIPKLVRETRITEIKVPYHPPVVNHIDPVSGQSGTTVTFFGQNLAGWKVYARISDIILLEGQTLEGKQFTVDIPDELSAGFHQIQVDISKLFRRTFVFEVESS